MTAPPSPTTEDDTTRKTDLNLSRVAAAALAAVTAAVVGSTLGAEGTLIGAGAASVITTVATAFYQASLERSRQRVRSLAHRTRPAATSVPSGQHLDHPSDRSRRLSRLSWGAVVVAAFGGFVLAMMAITGFEWASGGTVGGNGQGTTIGQVVKDQSGPPKPTLPPASPAPAGPTSQTPAEPTESSEPPTTSTTAPNGGDTNEQTPTPTTANRPRPSEVTPPPLIPGLPGVGG
jgi:hypothetical protein